MVRSGLCVTSPWPSGRSGQLLLYPNYNHDIVMGTFWKAGVSSFCIPALAHVMRDRHAHAGLHASDKMNNDA